MCQCSECKISHSILPLNFKKIIYSFYFLTESFLLRLIYQHTGTLYFIIYSTVMILRVCIRHQIGYYTILYDDNRNYDVVVNMTIKQNKNKT